MLTVGNRSKQNCAVVSPFRSGGLPRDDVLVLQGDLIAPPATSHEPPATLSRHDEFVPCRVSSHVVPGSCSLFCACVTPSAWEWVSFGGGGSPSQHAVACRGAQVRIDKGDIEAREPLRVMCPRWRTCGHTRARLGRSVCAALPRRSRRTNHHSERVPPDAPRRRARTAREPRVSAPSSSSPLRVVAPPRATRSMI